MSNEIPREIQELRIQPSNEFNHVAFSCDFNRDTRYSNSNQQQKTSIIQLFRKAKPNGTIYNSVRVLCGKLVNNKYSSNVILLCIVINAIMMGVATFDFIRNNAGPRDIFDATDEVFLIIFTIESALQFIYNGIDFFTDAWLIFDGSIVILSWSFATLQVIRAFRVFRAMRVVARIEALRAMIEAIGKAMPNISAIVLLTVLFLYIFSVTFTELFKELELETDYFTRLDKSAFTLLQIMTLDFGNPMREVLIHRPYWGWVPFIIYIIIAGFIIFNLTVGALCDAVSSDFDKMGDKIRKEVEKAKDQDDKMVEMLDELKLLTKHNMETQKIVDILMNKLIENCGPVKMPTISHRPQHFDMEIIETSGGFDLNQKASWNWVVPRVLSFRGNSDEGNNVPTSVIEEIEFFDANAGGRPRPELTSKEMISDILHKYRTPRPGEIQGFNKVREVCGNLVNNKYSSNFLLLCIVINAIMMGVATFDIIRDNPTPRDIFNVVDQVFLVIFSIESALQFIYRGVDFFTDSWLMFDGSIVILSWSFATLQVIRAFRVFRAMRVVSYIKAMKSMVEALADIIPRMSAIIILNILFLYIFSVVFTELFKNLELSVDYFSRLDKSAFTLLQLMTLDFGNPMREVLEFYPTFGWIPFIGYIIIAGFIIFNLIVGALCLSVSSLDDDADDKTNLEDLQEEMEYYKRMVIMEKQINSIDKQQTEVFRLIDSVCDSIYSIES